MALEEILKKSKRMMVVPLLGLALIYAPMCSRSYDSNLKGKQALVSSLNSAKTVEEYSLDYKIGVYFLGIRIVSCDLDFNFKKIEENGLVKEVVNAYGKYSDSYYGHFSSVVSKNEDPFEKHSYLIRCDQNMFEEDVTFYKDKVRFVEEGLEKTVDNDGYVGLQSVIKPLLTDDLSSGQVFDSKSFFEGDFYKCRLVVGEKESIRIKDKHVNAYHVVFETGKEGSNMSKVADFWVAKDKPYNKIVKASFSPFLFTEIVMLYNP